jgi:DNA-binding XRE family transcriptional regulator
MARKVYDRDDLSPTGEGGEVVTQGMYLELVNLVNALKLRRESMGLTIAEVARRSRLTLATVACLEDGDNNNPSLDTLFRFAMAMDAGITLGVEEIGPDDEAVG